MPCFQKHIESLVLQRCWHREGLMVVTSAGVDSAGGRGGCRALRQQQLPRASVTGRALSGGATAVAAAFSRAHSTLLQVLLSLC